jgi:hypothetical protein
VKWDLAGLRWVSVYYSDTNGCTTLPVIFVVNVNPLPLPAITGSDSTCVGTAGILYSTSPGMHDYFWDI